MNGIKSRPAWNRRRKRIPPGFTVIEVLTVAAVVAILAALLAPRALNVIARERVSGTVQSLENLKTATTAYLVKYGSLPIRDGSGSTNGVLSDGRFDADLVTAGVAPRLFTCSIGAQTPGVGDGGRCVHVRSQLAAVDPVVSAPTATAGGDNFDLDRDSSTADFTSHQRIVAAFIPRVLVADALELDRLLDGDTYGGRTGNTTGRCIYSSAASDGTVTVYVYIAHY